MARTITVAAAQTGSMLTDDLEDAVEPACAMIDEAAGKAYENGVFVVAPNRAGDEHGRRHIGKSMIVNPIGAEIMCVGGADASDVLVATLDLDDVTVAQKSLPWWRDRRPDLYGELVSGRG